MKTLKKILFLTTAVVLLFSCSKTDNDEPFSAIGLKAKKVTHEVFVVNPGGIDDTPALCQAFEDAKAAGPGSVVQLIEGEYHVGYMEIYDFYGSLMGAGKDKTIITVLPGMDLDALFAQHLIHSMVKFVGGDVHLSHFTMQTPPGLLSVGGPGWGHIYSLINFSSFNSVYESGNENRSINAVIDNVCFKGQRVEEGGYPGYVEGFFYNSVMGVRAGFDYFSPYVAPDPLLPREKINLKITNSDFDTFCYGLGIEGIKNSKIIVGEVNRGNYFINCDQQGGIWEFRDMEILVEGNIFNVYKNGFDQDNYPWYACFRYEPSTKATISNCHHNMFNLMHAEYGLWFTDVCRITEPEGVPVAYNIKNNLFEMHDAYDWGIRSRLTKGMVIRNNRFCGTGGMAISVESPYFEYYGVYNEEGLILGNNFSTAQFDMCAVWLRPDTRNWTVVGGNIKDQVWNDGVGNIITGVNVSSSDKPLGRSIKDKLPPMNQLIHELHK